MRSNPRRTYKQERCALTASLRRRTQAAEARVAEAREEQALAEECADAAEERAGRLYREIEAERAALLDFLESPEWERDLLVLVWDRVRAELLALSSTHQSCPHCGSFRRSFQEEFLQDAIDQLTEANGLTRVSPLLPPDWPVRMGRVTQKGRGLRQAWLD